MLRACKIGWAVLVAPMTYTHDTSHLVILISGLATNWKARQVPVASDEGGYWHSTRGVLPATLNLRDGARLVPQNGDVKGQWALIGGARTCYMALHVFTCTFNATK